MNTRFWITGVVLFVVTMAIGFVIHGTLLHAEYQALPIFRREADGMNYFPYMLLGHVALVFGIAWIYQQGVKAGVSWITQGLRFGIALSFVTTIPMYLIYYAVQPMPPALVGKQIVFDFIGNIIVGFVAAFINKPAE
jgi:hypothetical protein